MTLGVAGFAARASRVLGTLMPITAHYADAALKSSRRGGAKLSLQVFNKCLSSARDVIRKHRDMLPRTRSTGKGKVVESQGLVPVEIDSSIQESDFGGLFGKECYMFCQADTYMSYLLHEKFDFVMMMKFAR